MFRRPPVRLLPFLVALAACIDQPTAPGHGVVTAPAAQALVPGTSVFGTNEYVEYIPGNLPVIFSAPHGGGLQPAAIPERVAGAACGDEVTTVRDANTQELVRTIRDAFFARTGRYPHVIINRLHRDRLDANRSIGEAACGDAGAEQAWTEYQQFIETAKATVVAEHGRGWFTDVHGHGHAIPRLELGYELSSTTLRRTDAQLDATGTAEAASSIRTFSEGSALSFSALLRGPTALGTLFANAGYPSVPSAQDAAPDVGESYFSGGYNTDRHACSRGGQVCGVQIEAHNTGVRNTAAARSAFASTLVGVYREYLAQFGIEIPVAARPGLGAALIVDNDNAFNNTAWARFEASSSWTSGSNSQAWEANFGLSSGNPGATNDGAEFLFYVATPGTYTVDAWWPALSSRSPSVSYRIFELDGGARLADLTRDQRTAGAQWNPLGTYRFTRVGWAKVLISRSLSASGSIAADAIRVTQVNAPPVAVITLPAGVQEGAVAGFGAGGSSDPDDDALTWSWSFGDGTTATGASPTHVYADDGVFDVTLTAIDAHGASHSTTATLAVANVAPVVSLGAGGTILRGETWTGSGSFTDPGADTWNASVDFGAGSGARPLALDGRQFAMTNRYEVAGTFTVTVRVEDGDDAGSASTMVRVLGPGDAVAELASAVRARGFARGIENALLVKLDAAAAQVARDNAEPARGQLTAFVLQAGTLGEDGLAAYARRIIASME